MSELALGAGARMQEVQALTLRWFRRLGREHATLFFTLTQPVFWLVLFGSLFSVVGAGVVPEGYQGGYLAFVLPGILVLNILGAGLAAGIEVMFDKETGFLHRLLAAPIARSSIVTARLLFVVANSLVQVVILLGIAALMGVTFLGGAGGLAVVLLVAVLLAVALGALSLTLAFVYKSHGEFFATIGFVNMPLFFLSSALLPLAAMPGWMQAAARLNPLTYAIDLARIAATQGVPWAALPRSLGALLVADALFLALAVWVFRRKVD